MQGGSSTVRPWAVDNPRPHSPTQGRTLLPGVVAQCDGGWSHPATGVVAQCDLNPYKNPYLEPLFDPSSSAEPTARRRPVNNQDRKEVSTVKLCTYRDCGEPSETSRCPEHAYEEPIKASRQARGYDEAWTKLSRRARALQPWCSRCGATDDLTGDHLRWPARTLKDVDVLCRSCNAKKGKPDPDARDNPGGMTLDRPLPHPGGKAFWLTQSLVQSGEGGGARG